MKKLLCFLLLATTVVSCSDDDDAANQGNETASVQINRTSYVNNNLTKVMGQVNGTLPQDAQFGVVYGSTHNLTLENATVAPGQYYEDQNFTADLNGIVLNSTTYMRTYTTVGNVTTYSDETTYVAVPVVTINKVKNIGLYQCQVEVSIDTDIPTFYIQFEGTGSIPGALVLTENTSTNFTFNLVGNFTSGTNQLKAKINIGQPVAPPGTMIQCESNTFEFESIVGQTGEAGGLVILDKGETTDGWRYLERAPIGVESNATTIAACAGATTQTEIGSGFANTASIVANCDENSAAKLCDDFTYGGKDDWFLPSVDEVILLNGTFPGLLGGVFATSTYNKNVVFSHHYSPEVVTKTDDFVNGAGIVPVRRY